MPSGEMRMVKENCRATVGQIGLIEHSSFVHGKLDAYAGWVKGRVCAAAR